MVKTLRAILMCLINIDMDMDMDMYMDMDMDMNLDIDFDDDTNVDKDLRIVIRHIKLDVRYFKNDECNQFFKEEMFLTK